MRFSFTVPGPPVAWQRAGYKPGPKGKRRFFTQKKTRVFESAVWCAARLAGFRGSPWAGPVRVTVNLFMANARRRDIDNFAKSVLDGITSKTRKGRKKRGLPDLRLLVDDSQVVELAMSKSVDRREPRTEVEVEQLDLEAAQ